MVDDPESPKSQNSQAAEPEAKGGDEQDPDLVSPSRAESFSERKIRARLSVHDERGSISRTRITYGTYLYHSYTEIFIGLVTVVNFVVILVDADRNASGAKPSPGIVAVGTACLFIYTFELCIRLFVERSRIFSETLNWIDILVVTTGYVSGFFEIAEIVAPDKTLGSQSFLGALRTLRCLRLLRLIKAMVLVKQLKDLRRLLNGLGGCVRILFWALILVLLFMTIWATVAVELLNPLMADIAAETEAWEGCHRCERSFVSVLAASLTLFQTIVGGDSWGLVAIPVMEAYPFAAVIFIGSLFTINVGALSLIVAVLCDTSAEARLKDTEARFAESADEEKQEKKKLAKIFKMVDADGSGALDYEELAKGAEEVEEFRQTLEVMDIKGDDLYQLFQMLDDDESGELDPEEFIEALYRLKCGDNKTAATFVKHYVVHLAGLLNDMSDRMKTLEGGLVESVATQIEGSMAPKARDGQTSQLNGAVDSSASGSEGGTREGLVERLRQISPVSEVLPETDPRLANAPAFLRKSIALKRSNSIATAASAAGSERYRAAPKTSEGQTDQVKRDPTSPFLTPRTPKWLKGSEGFPRERQVSWGSQGSPETPDPRLANIPPSLRKNFALQMGIIGSPRDRAVDVGMQVSDARQSASSSHEGRRLPKPSPRQAGSGSEPATPRDLSWRNRRFVMEDDLWWRNMRHHASAGFGQEPASPKSPTSPVGSHSQRRRGPNPSSQPAPLGSTLTQDQFVRMMTQLVLCPVEEKTGDLSAELRTKIEAQLQEAKHAKHKHRQVTERWSSLETDLDHGITVALGHVLSSLQSFSLSDQPKGVRGPNSVASTGKCCFEEDAFLPLPSPDAVTAEDKPKTEDDALQLPLLAAAAAKGKSNATGVPTKLAEALAAQQAKNTAKAEARTEAKADAPVVATEGPEISLQDGLSELPPPAVLLPGSGGCSSRSPSEGLRSL